MDTAKKPTDTEAPQQKRHKPDSASGQKSTVSKLIEEFADKVEKEWRVHSAIVLSEEERTVNASRECLYKTANRTWCHKQVLRGLCDRVVENEVGPEARETILQACVSLKAGQIARRVLRCAGNTTLQSPRNMSEAVLFGSVDDVKRLGDPSDAPRFHYIYDATACGRLSILKFFYEKFGLPMIKWHRCGSGETVAHVAASSDRINILRWLVQKWPGCLRDPGCLLEHDRYDVPAFLYANGETRLWVLRQDRHIPANIDFRYPDGTWNPNALAYDVTSFMFRPPSLVNMKQHHLDLQSQNLGDHACNVIGYLFRTPQPMITSLNLSNNPRITDFGWRRLSLGLKHTREPTTIESNLVSVQGHNHLLRMNQRRRNHPKKHRPHPLRTFPSLLSIALARVVALLVVL